MDTSILLARVIGLSMIVLYVSVLKNAHLYKGFIKSITEQPLFLLITGFINLLLGLLILQVHSVWGFDWRVSITIVGWVLFISGIIRLLFPEHAIRFSKKLLGLSPNILNAICIALSLVGLFLTYKGFVG